MQILSSSSTFGAFTQHWSAEAGLKFVLDSKVEALFLLSPGFCCNELTVIIGKCLACWFKNIIDRAETKYGIQ